MIQFDRSDVYDFPGMVGISEPVSDFAENFFAAQDNMRLNDQSQSKELILKDLWTPIVEEMRETFPNQGFGGRDFENPADFLGIGLGVYSSAGGPQDRYNFAVNTLLNFMNENQESLPDHLKGITVQSLEDIAKERAQAARKYAEEVGARNFTFSGTLGQFTGGVSGLIDDPVNAFGLMGSSAKNLWRLAFTEAAIGAGTGAIAEAGVADWYEELGYDYTYQDFLRNVAYNTVGSAAFGVGIRVSADAAKSGWNAISNSGKANKDSQALADAAEAREELEADNPFTDANLPPAQAEHTSRTVSAEAAVENNTAPMIPNEATIQPSPYANVSDINDEMLALSKRLDEISQEKSDLLEGLSEEELKAQKTELVKKNQALDDERKKIAKRQEELGEEYQRRQNEAIANGAVDNLNGVMFSVNPRDVNVDAKRFQFKEGGDEYGVTERLRGVTEWDPIKAGTVIFWEDVDGKIFVADGHQRVGLARRIQEQKPDEKIEIIGYKLRETDGVSAEKARVIAAMTNIAQGTGTAIDAAKVLRIEPGRIAELPPQSVLVRQARDLVNLSNQAFGAIVNEVIPANYGAIVGRLIDDPDLQDAAIAVLAKSDPANLFQAEAIVRQVREMDTVQETQVSLFGEEIITDSLFTERARVLDRTTKLLRGDKAAFESLSKNAERIEAEGNKLAKEQNQRRADQDAQAITLLQALANRKGVLSDDLSAAARTARETGNYAEAARNFADAVRRGIERGDFDGASTGDVGRAVDVAPQSRADAIEEEPTLEGFDEPTGPAAEAQVDQMVLDTFRALEEVPVKEDVKAIERSLKDRQPVETVDDIFKIAQASQDFIDGIGRGLAKDLGINFKNPGLKKIETAKEKMQRKSYASAREMTDISRAGFVINKASDADAIVERLAQNAEILDEGWAVTPAGYFDRKILVRTPNGIISEIQIWSPKLIEAKNAKGHKLYEKQRMSKDPEEIDALEAQQRELYTQALSEEDPSFSKLVGMEKDPKVLSNADIKAASSAITRPELRTSRPSTAVQGPPGVSMARALEAEKDIAGRPSQETRKVSDIGEPPTEDISDITIDIKPDDFDLEIPLTTRFDEETGELLAETKTLRDIKADIDAEDALINRLGVCGL